MTTPVAVATETGTPPGSATPQPTVVTTPSPAVTSFTLSGRLVVDSNGNHAADSSDAAPGVAVLDLIPWSTADFLLSPDTLSKYVPVSLYSDPDGSFAFEDIPPDSYTLRVYWPFGFETKGAVFGVPSWLRAAFRVTDKGEIVAPDALPKFWPGSLEPLDPNEPILGAPPATILLKKVEDPNIVSVPVNDGGAAGPPPVGRVDVSAVLGRGHGAPVGLPSAGSVSDGEARGWLTYALAAAAIAILAAAAVLLRRAPR